MKRDTILPGRQQGGKSLLFVCIVSVLLLGTVSSTARAQAAAPAAVDSGLVPIEATVKGLGSTELVCLLKDTSVFLPAGSTLTYLRIKHQINLRQNRISGFLVSPETTFVIDLGASSIRVGKRGSTLSPTEYIVRGDEVYFSPNVYERTFLVSVDYRPRRLAASISTDLALPYVLDRRMRRLEREVMSRADYGDFDVLLSRPFRWLDGFRFDWFLGQSVGATRTPTRAASGALHYTILGGDLRSRYDLKLSPKFELVQSRHLWRYVPERSKLLRSILVGDFVTTGLLGREMYGVRLSSAPPDGRYFYGEETFSGVSFPNRRVYSFSGSVLARADAADSTGRYTFDVPVRYGADLVDFRSYNEWGELLEDSYRINIPESLVPAGEIDYTATFGRMRERGYPWYGQTIGAWGVSRALTLGVGAEYYEQSPIDSKIFPSLSGVWRVTSDIVTDALISPGALARGSFSALFPSLLTLNSVFTLYKHNRLFNPRDATYDFDFSGSLPFSVGSSRLGSSVFFRQSVLPTSRERILRADLSAAFGFFYPQVSFLSTWTHSYTRNITFRSIQELALQLRWRLRRAVSLGVGTGYDFLGSEITRMSAFASLTPITDLGIEFSYNRSFRYETSNLRFDLRFALPFVRAVASVISSRGQTYYSQRINGSIAFISDPGEFVFQNRSRSAFASYLLRPFVDENRDGIRGQNEPVVKINRPTVSFEKGFVSSKLSRTDGEMWGSLLSIPYREYLVRFENHVGDDPGLVPLYSGVRIVATPGSQLVYDIPFVFAGNIRGGVFRPGAQDLPQRLPVEGIKVRVRKVIPPGDTELEPYEKTVETFSNGEFEFSGLLPAEYELSLSGGQVQGLGYSADVYTKRITVVPSKEAMTVEGVEFMLSRNP